MQQVYKQYARTARIQNIESNFSGGVRFTNAPLVEGFNKMLINFDIDKSTFALRPRRGLTTLRSVEIPSGSTVTSGLFKAWEVNDKTFFALTDSTFGNNASGTTVLNTNTGYNIEDGVLGFNNEFYGLLKSETVNKYAYYHLQTNGTYILTDLTAKTLLPSEASSWGYNMLSATPYSFTDVYNDVAEDNCVITGLLPYKNSDHTKLALNAVIGDTVVYRANYSAKGTYNVRWEWKTYTDANWNKISDTSFTFGSSLTALFSAPHLIAAANYMVRLTVYKLVAEVETIAQSVVQAFTFSKADSAASALDMPIIDLKTATGIDYWRYRIGLYGVPGYETLLFLSDVNDPTYFPYPNNVCEFDENIKATVSYLDALLVFTESKLYRIELSADGVSFTQTCIQTGLDIADDDYRFINVINNMVFFKSNSLFYMVVPSVKLTTSLAVVNVSKNIEELLTTNYNANIRSYLIKLYGLTIPTGLAPTYQYNYVDYEDIHNLSVFSINSLLYNFDLIYNTVTRAWRVYAYISTSPVIPYRSNTVNTGLLITETDNVFRILTYNNSDIADSFTAQLSNIQYLETGYREHTSNVKKRYRELQLKLNNATASALTFSHGFVIDGVERVQLFTPIISRITVAPGIDNLSTTEALNEDSLLEDDVIAITDDTDDPYIWTISEESVPTAFGHTAWKIRTPISGKGYTAAFTLLSKNQTRYEILNTSWVFRLLNAR